MPRPEIVVHPRIRQQLGDDTIRLVLGHLAPGDYQTCNRPLGPNPVTLEASDYESKSIRPACAAQTRSGCSRQRGRPSSALPTCRVMAGGMTERMTAKPLDRCPTLRPDQNLQSHRRPHGRSVDSRPIKTLSAVTTLLCLTRELSHLASATHRSMVVCQCRPYSSKGVVRQPQ